MSRVDIRTRTSGRHRGQRYPLQKRKTVTNRRGKTYTVEEFRQKQDDEIRRSYGSGTKLRKFCFFPEEMVIWQLISRVHHYRGKNIYTYYVRQFDAESGEELSSVIWKRNKAYDSYRANTNTIKSEGRAFMEG